jgi:hypothetical protein
MVMDKSKHLFDAIATHEFQMAEVTNSENVIAQKRASWFANRKPSLAFEW